MSTDPSATATCTQSPEADALLFRHAMRGSPVPATGPLFPPRGGTWVRPACGIADQAAVEVQCKPNRMLGLAATQTVDYDPSRGHPGSFPRLRQFTCCFAEETDRVRRSE